MEAATEDGQRVSGTRRSDVLSLSAQGLPEDIVKAYAARGIRSLYEWQAECLALPGVADGRNLVYCAPTSGGKTLVSEIIMLRRVVKLRKPAIFVLPYVSIVTEKMRYFSEVAKSSKVSVKGFYGGSADSTREPFDIAVCTIEKANLLVNRLIEESCSPEGKPLDEVLGTVVVDELHLAGDGSRGYLLEVMLSKVLFVATSVQVVGLTATLPNVEDMAKWLGAALYRTGYRPVPLSEYVLVSRRLLHKDGSSARDLDDEGLSEAARAADKTGLVAATWEVTKESHNALVFCSSKVKCETVAQLLADQLPVAPGEAAHEKARSDLAEAIHRQPCGAFRVLSKTIPRGIAFHHGGLTTEERAIVERGYRSGTIAVICATSTLAAGVNLPARRVIFHSPYMGNSFLDSTQYKQMSGRAGRAGQGVLGESMLIAAPGNQAKQALELLDHCLPPVKSCLQIEGRGLMRLLLDVLTVTPLGTGEELIKFCSTTLLACQKEADGQPLTGNPMLDYPEIASAVRWLLEHDMLRLDERVQAYSTTPLGQAVCSSGLEPGQGYFLWQELQRARPCVSLDTDLHICYLVTPAEGSVTVDWNVYARVLNHLSKAERRVAERVGVRLDLVDQAKFQGKLAASQLASLDGMRLVRFYNSLVLWAVLHETPPEVVLRRFTFGHGQLQQLQQAAAAFTTTVAVFCNKLQWHPLEALILSFQQRLTFGVRQELVPLKQLEQLDNVRARALYEHGFTTPLNVASARPIEVLRVLRKTLPHDVPAASYTETHALQIIDAAKAVSRSLAQDKRRQAREARKRMRDEAPGQTDCGTQAAEALPPKRQCNAVPTTAAAVLRRPAHISRPGPQSASNGTTPAAMPAWQVVQDATAAPPAHPPPPHAGTRQCNMPGATAFVAHPGGAAHVGAQALAKTAVGVLQHLDPPAQHTGLDSLRQVQSSLPGEPAAIRVPTANPARERQTQEERARFTAASVEDLFTCATPCRSADWGAAASHPSYERKDDGAAPLSPAQLSEGLQRVGRRSLTPRDVEAVQRSPGAATPTGDAATKICMSGTASTGSTRSQAADGLIAELRKHQAAAAEASFLASPFAAATEAGAGWPVVPIIAIASGDSSAYVALERRLIGCCYIGASVVVTAGSEEAALCLTFGPNDAVLLPLPPALQSGQPTDLRPEAFQHWFADPRHLCITPDAKELVAALIWRGVDVHCSLAEPRIAYWLLDPDDKQMVMPSEMASIVGIQAAPPNVAGSLVQGNASTLNPALRARALACWPESFLAMPLMAALLKRLDTHQLLESFWGIEMPIAAILAWMDHVGIACMKHDPHHTHSRVVYKLAAIEERARELVGRHVQLSSSEDVGRALFEDLGIHPPPGIKFRRKNNGRLAFRSSVELLRRLPAPTHPLVELILEHRRLAHVARRFENLRQAGEAPRSEPCCKQCLVARKAGSSFGPATTAAGATPWTLPRLRTELVQTATATGRLATASGSLPLLQLENSFSVRDVQRTSIHMEIASRQEPERGVRVFAAMAAHAPPQQQVLREGLLEAVQAVSCADAFDSGTGQSLASYWVAHGWDAYADEAHARAVHQVLVRHHRGVFSYPADKVWRLAAPVRVADDTPMLVLNPRSLLVADAGKVLLSADYSQLEVRLMAHFSQDHRFTEILRGGGDVFRHVAAGWLHKAEEDITAEERSGAKRITYGLIYGVGAGRLAVDLGIRRSQAEEFQSSFMRQYTGIATWIQACREQARARGYVETLHGRRRFLPALAARGQAERSHAERQAVNTACQASAADLMKLAMVRVHDRLRQLRAHDGSGGCHMVGRILLQIHDELLLEVEDSWLNEVKDMVLTEMIGTGMGLRVPLQVKWRVGRSWGHLE